MTLLFFILVRSFQQLTLSAVMIMLFSIIALSAGKDKNGVSPTAISIPSGPGSIEGLGSDFQPQLNTGTSSYNVPLNMPQGVAGHTPALSINYEGGSGNSCLGIGWSLSIPSLRRQCEKGIPQYTDGDRFLNPSGEELVQTEKGYFFPENQQEFVRYWYHNSYWEAWHPDGSKSIYGQTPSAHIHHGEQIYQWLLEKQIDPNGNTIEYRYTEYPNSNNQKYLSEIRYGPGEPPWQVFYVITLTYEDRPDVMDDYRSGFLIRNSKRLSQIDMALQGSAPEGHLISDINTDGIQDALIRRYELKYETDEYWSFLSSVTQIGADGVSSLPPAVFGYDRLEPSHVISAAGSIISVSNEPSDVMDNSLVDLIDINADGLPDILKTRIARGGHYAYLNEGTVTENNNQLIQWSNIVEVGSSQSGGLAWNLDLQNDEVSLTDMDGDGLADLVYNPSEDPNPRYFRNFGKKEWGPRELMATEGEIPPAPFGNDNVKTIDINFDKRMDIVQSLPGRYKIWYNLGPGENQWQQYAKVQYATGAIHDNQCIQFSESGFQFADLNGDRLTDVARIDSSRIICCLNKGWGEFADSVVFSLSPDDGYGHDDGFGYLTDYPGGQIERASLRDITGDGLADLVVERARGKDIWFWINLGNRGFSSRYIITDLPANNSNETSAVRWADINGNGTTDLIYADSNLSDGNRLRIVDLGLLLNGSATPNLIAKIENGIGKTVLIEYKSSTDYAAEDACNDNPWQYPIPNPVTVISRITILDGLGNDYVTELRYHNGYYDGVEKEFRGFARAEQWDLGDESQPTLVTEYLFDLGIENESLKGKPLKTIVKTEDGKVFQEEHNLWQTRNLLQIDPLPVDPLIPAGVTYPFLTNQTQIIKEEPSGIVDPVTLESEFAYDDYGNKVKEANYGRVQYGNRNYGSDERISWTVFSATPDSAFWNLPVKTIISDNSSLPKIISWIQNYFDGQEFIGLPLGNVTIGNLTRSRKWVGSWNPSNPPEPLPEPESRFLQVTEDINDNTYLFSVVDASGTAITDEADQWINEARNQYDQYGNIISIADPLCNIDSGSPDDLAGHFRRLCYDPHLQSYPIEEYIYTGDSNVLVMRVAYDLAFGMITDSWDFNENHSQYTYDKFSRITKIIKPGGNPADTYDQPTIAYDYVLADSYTKANGEKVIINRVETRMHERYGTPDPEGYFISRSFIDGLGREILTKEEDEQEDRSIVKQAVIFNERGKPFISLLPFYSKNGLVFEDITASDWICTYIVDGDSSLYKLTEAPQTKMYYDASGREFRTFQSDDTFSEIQYFPLVRKLYDEEDTNTKSAHYQTPMVYYEDGLGRLIGVDEVVKLNDDGSTRDTAVSWRTTYTYDLLDNLINIRDSQNNEKIMRFDAMKRKVFMHDPDRGLMFYRYDDASNLTETVDAKNQRITYTYDGANRLLTEDYHDEGSLYSQNRFYDSSQPLSSNNRPDVIYNYDTPVGSISLGNCQIGAGKYTNGFLSWIEDLSGEEHLSYDERGRAVWTVKRIPDPLNNCMISFKMEMTYDALDRVIELIYPDEDRVTYEYNERNLLDKITGGPSSYIIQNIEYTPIGQKQYCAYGNQVSSYYSYDNRLRMNSLTTARYDESDQPILAYGYTFDGASNITRIDDMRPGSLHPSGDVLRNTQIFTYDNLYRLTEARYSFALPDEADRDDGSLQYRYDRIGNMLSKTSNIEHEENGKSITNIGNMSYGATSGSWNRFGRTLESAGPHALTSTENGEIHRTFSYDQNGNMTDIDGMRCVWDYKDRLVSVDNDGIRAEYVYDYNDRRIAKKVWNTSGADAEIDPATTTLYTNKYYEIRENDQPVKYVFQGDTRVARITSTIDRTSERVQRIRIYKGWNLISLAVDTYNLREQLNIDTDDTLKSAYRWDVIKKVFIEITHSDNLPAGTVIWILANEDSYLSILGTYNNPAKWPVTANGTFVPYTRREAILFKEAFSYNPKYIGLFDAKKQYWRTLISGALSYVSDLPDYFNPNQAVYVHAQEAQDLIFPPQSQQILYYHQDHLGSSNIIADAHGSVIEENLNYPYGFQRTNHKTEFIVQLGNYNFSQKEKDSESGVYNFEDRYLLTKFGRFMSVDKLKSENLQNKYLLNSQNLNTYHYTLNNPLKYIDPSGNDEEESNREYAENNFQFIDKSGKSRNIFFLGGWKDPKSGGVDTYGGWEITPKGEDTTRLANQFLERFKSLKDKNIAIVTHSWGNIIFNRALEISSGKVKQQLLALQKNGFRIAIGSPTSNVGENTPNFTGYIQEEITIFGISTKSDKLRDIVTYVGGNWSAQPLKVEPIGEIKNTSAHSAKSYLNAIAGRNLKGGTLVRTK